MAELLLARGAVAECHREETVARESHREAFAGRGAMVELLLARGAVAYTIGRNLLQKRQLWLVRQIIHIFAGGRVGEEHLRAER